MKEYSNKNITIVWNSKECCHCGACTRELPSVFDYHAKPWININGASESKIKNQVARCITGAISIKN